MTRIPDFEIRDAAPGCGAFELVLGGVWQFEPERQAVERHLVAAVNEVIQSKGASVMLATGENLYHLEKRAAGELYHLAECGDIVERRRGWGEPLAWHYEGKILNLKHHRVNHER